MEYEFPYGKNEALRLGGMEVAILIFQNIESHAYKTNEDDTQKCKLADGVKYQGKGASWESSLLTSNCGMH